MSTYDEYEPVPSIPCPWCGADVLGYQGKDGPNRFFLWRQGQRHPVEWRVDEDIRLAPQFEDYTLPERFSISGFCSQDHAFTVDCQCRDGLWCEVDVSAEVEKVEEKRLRDLRRRQRGY